MKQFGLFAITTFGFIGFSWGQTPSDSIFVAKSFWGYNFYQTDVRLNFNQLPYIMEENKEAHLLIKKARSNHTISSILSGAGGFLIGWQLGTALFGGEPNWAIAGVGGGLIVISIPLYSKSYRQSLEAIDIYNSGLLITGLLSQLSIGMTPNGVGIKLEF